METRRLISLLFVFAASLGAAFPQASLRVNNTTGAVQSDGVSELFWTSTANQAAIATALSGRTLVSPTITGTMSGSFTRSGTTTGGTFAATTLTGTTNFNAIVGTSSVITTASSGTATATTLTVSGSTTANGNTTLGDASGDTLTINAGTVTAINATSTGSSSVLNQGLIDARVNLPIGTAPQIVVKQSGTTFPRIVEITGYCSLAANTKQKISTTGVCNSRLTSGRVFINDNNSGYWFGMLNANGGVFNVAKSGTEGRSAQYSLTFASAVSITSGDTITGNVTGATATLYHLDGSAGAVSTTGPGAILTNGKNFAVTDTNFLINGVASGVAISAVPIVTADIMFYNEPTAIPTTTNYDFVIVNTSAGTRRVAFEFWLYVQ